MSASTLSDERLSCAIAAAIGLRLHETSRWGLYANRDGGEYPYGDWRPLKPYATSLDALSEPEQRLRDAGNHVSVTVFSGGDSQARWFDLSDKPITPLVDAPTEARARAEAVLAGLKALTEARS